MPKIKIAKDNSCVRIGGINSSLMDRTCRFQFSSRISATPLTQRVWWIFLRTRPRDVCHKLMTS
jgi:hypothetical protein